MGPDHRIILDVCHLGWVGVGARWHVVVTAEHWWDSGRELIRDQLWASHVSGNRDRVMAWFQEQAATYERPD